MNLLFFIFSLSGGGAERVTVNLANHWAAKGWRITIVTLAPVAQDAYALHPSIVRVSLSMAASSKTVTEGLSRNLKRVRALRRTLLDIRPDIAIGMMGSACVTLALASRGLTNIAPIGSIHIHPPAFPTKFVWSALQSLAFGQLSSVAALTQATAAWLRANTRARRIDVIPNPILWPVPESDPGIEPSTVCKPDRKMLLAAGRLDPQKGFDLLIPAFAGLADKNPDWDLVILGEGAGRERLQAEISARGLESRVFLPGWAGNVAAWYARAQLYVMSSRFEGFPLTLAEAMAHGLPAISFDCDTGPRDIIRSGVDGFLIPPENVPALTEGLDRLMGDDGLRSTIASAAKQARDRFSMESVARMWENMFDEFLSPKVGQQA